MGRLKTWIGTARPKTLGASVAPILLAAGISLPPTAEKLFYFLVILLCALCIQIATNLINDYSDFERGVDTAERLGPTRAAVSGKLSAAELKKAAASALTLAALLGLVLVEKGGLPILLIGLCSLSLAALYSLGRFALAFTGLADLFVLLFFGPVAVCGSCLILTGHIPRLSVPLGFATGALSTGILAANNLRDRHSDRIAGRKTLAIRFGESFARYQYAACMLAPLLMLPLTVLVFGLSPLLLAPLLYLLFAVRPVSLVLAGLEGRELNEVLAMSGKATLVFGALYFLSSALHFLIL